jgi:hypothetical protein
MEVNGDCFERNAKGLAIFRRSVGFIDPVTM